MQAEKNGRRWNLAPLLRFESVAFIGASDSSNFGKGAYRALNEIGYSGRYFPVNPNRTRVHEVQAFPTVRDIPQPIEAAVIALRRDSVLRAVEDSIEQGAKALVVLSSNFAEADQEGRDLQAHIAAYAHERNIILVGPNCLGVASFVNRCALFQGRGLGAVRLGNVGLVSQSGGILIESLAYSTARGVGFSHIFSTGNEAAITFEDALDFLVDDPATAVLVAVIETSRNPALFLAAAERAATLGKPLIVLKLGVSEKGAQSAMTHTGALTGSEKVWKAALRQHAAVSARDIDELVDLIAIFSGAADKLRARGLQNVGIIEISGGATELNCDLAEAAGVTLPSIAKDAEPALRAALPEFLAINNPLDLGIVWVDPAMATRYPAALEAFANTPEIDVIVSRYIVPPDGPLGDLNLRINELEVIRTRHPDRLFVAMTPTSERFSPEWTAAVARLKIPFLQGLGRGMDAMSKLAAYSRAIDRRRRPTTAGAHSWNAIKSFEWRHTAPILSEIDSKNVLRNIGLPVVPTVLATSVEAAATAAEKIGYPVVAKIVSPQLTHKSDVGGVRLNIRSSEDLAQVFAQFRDLVEARDGAQFQGISVQPMAPSGLEIIIGAERDPQVGPVIVFGLGGVLVEVLSDVTIKLAPLSFDEALQMLEDIRGRALLYGARGRAAADRLAIANVLVRVSELMIAEPTISSIDINPAFVYADGLSIVDARIATIQR